MTDKITAWSYSRYQTYDQCPLKAKLQFIDKLRTASSPALENGLLFHKECERYLKGQVERVPPLLKVFAKELKKLRKEDACAEVEFCINSRFEKVDWFSREAWLRVKVDALVMKPGAARVVDFKTGKVRDSHVDQLGLYALIVFVLMPDINEVESELWYFDEPLIKSHTFMREEMEALKAEWADKTAAMLSDTEFAPNPTYLCNYCSFSKNSKEEGNKGRCQF